LGQELAGEIEGERIGPVPCTDALEAGGDAIERIRPVDPREASVRLPQHGMKQTFGEPERLAECRALRADAAEIRWMGGIAGDRGAAISVGPRQQATTHAAIGAGGAHGREFERGRVHGGVLQPLDVTATGREQTADAPSFPKAFSPSEPATPSCMAITGWLS